MKVILLLACMLLAVCFVFSYQNHGIVILCGGGEIPNKAVDTFKNHSKQGKFVIVTYNDSCQTRWCRSLDNPVFVLPENIRSQPISTIRGLIIEGGDQWKYVCRLDGKYIDDIHRAGIPILATSAGAMSLGEYMFTAEKDTITSEEAIAGQNVCLLRGLVNIPCLRGKIVDTHFTSRNRIGRLQVFVKKTGATIGIGIDDHTALCIDGCEFTTIGDGKVTLVEDCDENLY